MENRSVNITGIRIKTRQRKNKFHCFTGICLFNFYIWLYAQSACIKDRTCLKIAIAGESYGINIYALTFISSVES